MSWLELSWEAKRGAVLSDAHFTCQMCFDNEAVEVDHVWPRALGGSDRRVNLRATCRPCNRSKGLRIFAADVAASPEIMDDGLAHFGAEVASSIRSYMAWSVIAAAVRAGYDVMEAQDTASEALTDRLPDLLSSIDDFKEALVADLCPSPVADVFAAFFDSVKELDE